MTMFQDDQWPWGDGCRCAPPGLLVSGVWWWWRLYEAGTRWYLLHLQITPYCTPATAHWAATTRYPHSFTIAKVIHELTENCVLNTDFTFYKQYIFCIKHDNNRFKRLNKVVSSLFIFIQLAYNVSKFLLQVNCKLQKYIVKSQCAAVQCTLSQWSLIDNSSHTIKNRPSVKSHRKQSHTPLSKQQLGYPGKNSNCTCLSFFLGFYYIHNFVSK